MRSREDIAGAGQAYAEAGKAKEGKCGDRIKDLPNADANVSPDGLTNVGKAGTPPAAIKRVPCFPLSLPRAEHRARRRPHR